MSSFTVLGASGFIGSNLARHLRDQQMDCWCPSRADPVVLQRPLGHVIYSIGVTADFRRRPFDTVRAHCCALLDVLERGNYDSFLYLSSARLYRHAAGGDEDAALMVVPRDPDQLYDASKLTGESLCLSCDNARVRVARLSNVYGPDHGSPNFLARIIRSAVADRRVVFETSLNSHKDYVSVGDVVRILPQISEGGQSRMYNLASGSNTSNGVLADILRQHTACAVEVAEGAPTVTWPAVSIRRITAEFDFRPSRLTDDLGVLIQQYREAMG